MRTTVTLDDDVYEAAQALAQATGKRLGQVLSEMARQALQPPGQAPKISVGRASRFPVFDVPADAGSIPASRVQRALDEPDRGELARRLLGAGRKFSPDRDAVAELVVERAHEE